MNLVSTLAMKGGNSVAGWFNLQPLNLKIVTCGLNLNYQIIQIQNIHSLNYILLEDYNVEAACLG